MIGYLATILALIALGGPIIAGDSSADTAGGWMKHPGNPVLGGQYGTCFDVAVPRRTGLTACGYRGGQNGAWHWWRARTAYRGLPRRSSCRPRESPGPMTSTVRPCLERSDGYHMWFTGQTKGRAFLHRLRPPDLWDSVVEPNSGFRLRTSSGDTIHIFL